MDLLNSGMKVMVEEEEEEEEEDGAPCTLMINTDPRNRIEMRMGHLVIFSIKIK